MYGTASLATRREQRSAKEAQQTLDDAGYLGLRLSNNPVAQAAGRIEKEKRISIAEVETGAWVEGLKELLNKTISIATLD